MTGRMLALAVAAMSVTACNQGDGATNNAANAAATAAAAPKRPTYCFFKDAATRGWAASVDSTGNVVVKGQAKLEDRRYQGLLSQSEVAGDKASVWVTMGPNTTGMGAVDNWWDVSLTVPDSGAVTSVTVLCGKKPVAELQVKRG